MRNPKSGFSRHLAKRGQLTFTGAPRRSQTHAFRLIRPIKVHATVSQLCSVSWVQTMIAWESSSSGISRGLRCGPSRRLRRGRMTMQINRQNYIQEGINTRAGKTNQLQYILISITADLGWILKLTSCTTNAVKIAPRR